ncbi:MAG TPA: Clp protease N-terminal domain-containing protein [Actinoplanes sp.]|nr:Clp protease N-terminal domain-containing protein [Actinoplanes sp.]
MFERFTDAARTVVFGAQEQARALGHSWIGTEHLLLALLADPGSATSQALRDNRVDAQYVRTQLSRLVGSGQRGDPGPQTDRDAEDAAALKAIGIDLDAVRRAIEENFGPGALYLPRDTKPKRKGLLRRFSGGSGGGGRVPFSSRAKKVLELSLREAIRLKHSFIAPEHIMLGLLREGNGLACQILSEAGVDFTKLRADVTRSLDDRAA